MALIQCPECKAQISDKAGTCPKCGYPISSPAKEPEEVAEAADETQTVQLTSKTYKAQQLYAVLAIIIGIILAIWGFSEGSATASPFGTVGLILFVGGFIWFIVARLMAWWHHG